MSITKRSVRTAAGGGLVAVALTAVAVIGNVGLPTASALEVAVAWDGGTDVLLTSAETRAAISDGIYASSGMCSDAVTRSYQAGIYFSDTANMKCSSWLVVCAQDAARRGNALSGTRFYADTYKCLVR